jgi:hypothetical protein
MQRSRYFLGHRNIENLYLNYWYLLVYIGPFKTHSCIFFNTAWNEPMVHGLTCAIVEVPDNVHCSLLIEKSISFSVNQADVYNITCTRLSSAYAACVSKTVSLDVPQMYAMPVVSFFIAI